ncbi:MAG TPA: hypothetical protein VFR14_11265, partial [Candidatus Limnocylindrales bacterium]|nr:hypothetical protein [Candidatus Limnocylindrales bacterium]
MRSMTTCGGDSPGAPFAPRGAGVITGPDELVAAADDVPIAGTRRAAATASWPAATTPSWPAATTGSCEA